jgi:predicted ThiF/HesA family dinucleotide-utilizing enzyme
MQEIMKRRVSANRDNLNSMLLDDVMVAKLAAGQTGLASSVATAAKYRRLALSMNGIFYDNYIS